MKEGIISEKVYWITMSECSFSAIAGMICGNFVKSNVAKAGIGLLCIFCVAVILSSTFAYLLQLKLEREFPEYYK